MTELSDTPAWVADAVFYQIFPDRFAASARVEKPGPLQPWDAPPTYNGYKGGDLLGIVEHLDYLSELGINALYLTPVFSSASNHRYHTYDYYQVDPLLGGNAAFQELLDSAHARGMKVILDGVFNHSGRGFWPFHHVVENGWESPYVDWFYLDKEGLKAGKQLRPYPSSEEGRRLAEASTQGHRQGEVTRKVLGYRAWWDLPALPKLNTDNPFMREHLLGAAEHWLRFGIDGWRLDVAEEIDAGYWREFRQRCRAVNPDAYIVAEIWREK
ncbi:MAG: alpha-amylase family glycosyl hydrolase, partial [Chloroflexota bacterium]